MSLIICGHPRSGTSMLRDLCNKHPEMTVLGESAFYKFVDRPWLEFAVLSILKILTHAGGNQLPRLTCPDSGEHSNPKKYRFLKTFYWALLKRFPQRISANLIEEMLRDVFPESRIVGDKYPGYIFGLNQILSESNARCIAMLRDPRDVTASVLEKIESGNWRGAWTKKFDTASKIADSWVKAFRALEIERERVFLIRYEEFVQDPERTLTELSDWLGVDPLGFSHQEIHPHSVGKFHKALSYEELRDVESAAGATMDELGMPRSLRIVE